MEAQEPDGDEEKNRIGAFYDFAVSEGGREFRIEAYCDLSTEEAEKVAKVTAENVEGYYHVLDSHAVHHAMKKHGDERERLRGQLPITRSDFLYLPMVVTKPDSIEFAGKTKPGRNALLYKKSIGEEILFLVEEIRTGRKQLAMVTLYKKERPA